jgi:4-cresol dehydrogenase (hydroxylating)
VVKKDSTEPLTEALLDWKQVLSAPFVISDDANLAAAETATFATSQRIPVILCPASVEEVREIVRIANLHGVALYPVSSGKNWGYGSRVPIASGCALVDLRRMNRITAFDDRLGCVTVQPGVTQSDLFGFLQTRGSKFWMDATGSSPDCSLIGNAMERGFGHTPYGDHFSNVCGLEVVLANGEVIRTGHAGFAGAKAAQAYRWGAGPSLDGLFSQSNFGIVTEMTIWLMPAPECFEAFFFQSDSEDGLRTIVDALRPLRLDGTLRSSVHIGNDYKVMAGTGQFPWEEQTPLTPERMKVLRGKLKISRWSGSGGLYGTRAQVAEAKRLMKRALAGKVDKLKFLDDRLLSFASRFTGMYKLATGVDLSRTLELLRPVYGLLKGVPTNQPLSSTYWRKRTPVPADPDPDRDRCGLLWLAPVARMDGQEAEALRAIAEPALLAHGFEPQISWTLLTERALSCVISITYDRDVRGEDDRAMQCFRNLKKALDAEGYYSYRLGIAAMDLTCRQPAYDHLLQSLKRAVDPNGILAPGRYVAGDKRQV